jgi:hypothetical protein
MERMEQADLSFAVQIESVEDGWRPQDGVACLQRLLIEVPHRQVQPRQVVEDEDPACEQWNQQREQQRGAAGRDKPAKLGRVPRRMIVA